MNRARVLPMNEILDCDDKECWIEIKYFEGVRLELDYIWCSNYGNNLWVYAGPSGRRSVSLPLMLDSYGKIWRVWSNEPTEEQRLNEKWRN